MRARDVMTSPVVTVGPDTTVQRALALLADHGFTALPVTDEDDRLIGIVSEPDLVRGRIPRDVRFRTAAGASVDDEGEIPQSTVGAVMTSEVVTTPASADLAELAATMIEGHHRAVPVVNSGRLVGIVTGRDIVRAISRDDEAIAREVRRRLTVYGGPARWDVDVRGGVATIGDVRDSAEDRHVARLLAESVPGVVRAQTRHRAGED